MRERNLEAFDAVRIDCLNGEKYKTGKVAPESSHGSSIFSTEGDPVGLQVGAAHSASASRYASVCNWIGIPAFSKRAEAAWATQSLR